MSLQREAILQRAKDMLMGRTAAGRAVYVNKAEPDAGASLPIVSLYGVSERRGEFEEEAPVRHVRTLTLLAEIKIADPISATASLRMNMLAEQVERILLRNPSFPDASGEALASGSKVPTRWVGADLVIDSESAAIVLGISIKIEVDYIYEPEEEAPANVRNLLKVHADYDLPGGAGVDAQDDVALQGS